MKKILYTYFTTVLLGILLFISIYMVVTVSKSGTPELFGYRVFRVLTGSMEPKIEESSCIIVKHVSESDLREGDIITFRSQDPTIYGFFNTHRIYKISTNSSTGETLYTTKGDSNLDPDDVSVRYIEIAGKYVGKVPFGNLISRLIQLLSDSKYYFLFIICPLILCLISYCYKLVIEIRKSKQGNQDVENDTDSDNGHENGNKHENKNGP